MLFPASDQFFQADGRRRVFGQIDELFQWFTSILIQCKSFLLLRIPLRRRVLGTLAAVGRVMAAASPDLGSELVQGSVFKVHQGTEKEPVL